jgi:hypothetical protein
MRLLLPLLVGVLAGCATRPSHEHPPAIPGDSITAVIEAKRDLWGDAALKQGGGPSYEFFEKLLPPLRYVDADFKCYPIMMSAPGAPVKGRLVSDGSSINALARQPNWTNERGLPVRVLVGREREAFGKELAKVEGPTLAEGWLPIVSLQYGAYSEEVFASVDKKYAESGAVVARFDFPAADQGRVELRIEQEGHEQMKADGGVVRDAKGRILLAYDGNWEFNGFRASLTSREKHGKSAVIVVFTEPIATSSTKPVHAASGVIEEEAAGPTSKSAAPRAPEIVIDEAWYARQRDLCVKEWKTIVDKGTQLQIPEPIVQNAWRALIVQQHQIRVGDQMNYSASNQYARQYANESGDSIRSLALFGHPVAAGRAMKPLFVYRRPGIELHDAGFKLEDLADYYFLTRDRKLIDELRPLWQREIDLILSSRQRDTGLMPRERYCSDIATPVLSLNNNANCWRGLRDMALVLDEIGDHDQAHKLTRICDEYRPAILAAMEKATVRTVDPAFIPVALGGEEPLHDPITATRLGSYWNLVIPCVLWSGIFPPDSEPATNILRTIKEKGGLCMGMTRVQSVRGFWVNPQNIDDLYGIRYVLALLYRDEVDQALVSFYGKLAQGFTRNTFYDGESTGIEPVDALGRQIALPPNSTANARFLMQLRYMLVQDWDRDADGRADTLRLCFGTSRRWLEDGKEIAVQRAPTAFGELSLKVKSQVKQGKVFTDITLPDRNPPQKILLKLRLPEGYKLINAQAGETTLKRDHEIIDLTGLKGSIHIVAQVEHH